jgi:hypothetical protein
MADLVGWFPSSYTISISSSQFVLASFRLKPAPGGHLQLHHIHYRDYHTGSVPCRIKCRCWACSLTASLLQNHNHQLMSTPILTLTPIRTLCPTMPHLRPYGVSAKSNNQLIINQIALSTLQKPRKNIPYIMGALPSSLGIAPAPRTRSDFRLPLIAPLSTQL